MSTGTQWRRSASSRASEEVIVEDGLLVDRHVSKETPTKEVLLQGAPLGGGLSCGPVNTYSVTMCLMETKR